MLPELLLKAIGGGVTGYITNSLAIKMLFRKYGPFGGVILKTKDEFIENISSLVERDIINHHTIEDELSKEEFRVVIKKIIDEILQIHIINNIKQEQWSDIPGIDSTLKQFTTFIKDNSHQLLTDNFNYLVEKTEIKDLISDEQLIYLSRNILDIFLDIFQNTDILAEITSENQVIDQLMDNLKDLTSDFHLEIRENEKEIDRVLNILYDELHLSESLITLARELKEKTPEELIGNENVVNFSKHFLEKGKKILNSSEGEELIYKTTEAVFISLKEVDHSLLDLFDVNTGERIESFLAAQLPDLIEGIVSWIRNNQLEIENIIDSSVEDVLERGSGIRNWIKKMIYKNIGNLSREYKLIDKIITGLEDETDLNQLSEEAAGIIIENIRNKKIGDIISSLEENNILKINKIAAILNNILINILDKIDIERISYFSNKKIKDIIDFKISNSLNNYIKKTSIRFFKEKFVFSERLTEIFHSQLDQLNGAELSRLVNTNKSKLIKKIKINKDSILEKAAALTRKKNIGNVYISNFLDRNTRNLMVKTLEKMLSKSVDNWILRFNKKRISIFIKKLKNIKGISSKLTDLLLELINNNLSNLLEGRIKNTVADNLHQLSEDRVQETLEDFIGTELKPITTFGAILGVLAGTGLYFAQGLTDASLITSILTYGFVGYITNVIALWMIFHPYQEKRLLGLKIPQTPGVVARNKPRFASSMGNFIDKELLSSDTVDKILREKRADIEISFKESISRKDFEILETLLLKNSPLIADRVYNLSLNYIKENRTDLILSLIDELQELDLKKYESDSLKGLIKKKIKSSDQYISKYINNFLRNNSSLESIFPDSLKKEILDQITTKLLEITENNFKDEKNIEEFISHNNSAFKELLEKKPADFLTPSQKKSLTETFKNYFIKDLGFEVIAEYILEEIRPEKSIDQLFDGTLIRKLKNNSGFFIDIFLVFLKMEQGRFVNGILNSINRELTPLEQASFAMLDGKKTVEDVIANIIEYKIPDFLYHKKDELEGVLNDNLDKLKSKKIMDSGIKFNRTEIYNILDRLVDNNVFSDLFEHIIDSGLELKFLTLFRLLDIDSALDFYRILRNEINQFGSSISRNLVLEEKLMKKELLPLFEKIFEEQIFSLTIRQLAADIGKDDLSRQLNIIADSTSFTKGLDLFFHQIQNRDLGQILNINFLNRDLNLLLNKIINNKQYKVETFSAFQQLFKLFSLKINEIAVKPSKDYFLDLILTSTFNSVENNFVELINTINIKELSRREIERMDPEEIEDMFYSFSGSYFTRLKFYGWLGSGIGGITELLSILKEIT